MPIEQAMASDVCLTRPHTRGGEPDDPGVQNVVHLLVPTRVGVNRWVAV